MEVRKERTGWRDPGLSARHRLWGWDCPAIDIDFLMLEYDTGEPIAFVEYKNEWAEPADPKHPSFKALINAGNRASLPVFGCRYTSDYHIFKLVPLNASARILLPNRTQMTEKQYVAFQYKLRGRIAKDDLLSKLNG